MDEFVDVFTTDGYKTGETLLREEAIKQGKLIKAFQIWILNNENQVLIERRSKRKTSRCRYVRFMFRTC